MPAFFVISGYLYRPRQCLKTIKCLVIPIIIYSTVNLVFKFALDMTRHGCIDLFHYATMSWRAFYAVAWGKDGYVTLFVGVWFVVVLALCRCLMGDVKYFKFISQHYIELALLMMLWMVCEKHIFPTNSSDIQDMYLYRVLSCFPFMALGKFIKEQQLQLVGFMSYKLPPPKNLQGTLSKILILILGIIVVLDNGLVYVWSNDYGDNTFVFFTGAIILSFSLFKACNYLKANMFIKTISNGTLMILGVHSITIVVFHNALELCHIANTSIEPWIVGLLTMFVCYYPIQWLSLKFPILLGK